MYNVPTTKATKPGNILGVSGLFKQFANKADLTVSKILSTLFYWELILYTVVIP